MEIYVVRKGDTLYSISRACDVPLSRLIADNQLPDPSRLVVGQALVIRRPTLTHRVLPGQTLSSIAAGYDVTVRELLRQNPSLGGSGQIFPGQTLIVACSDPPDIPLRVNGYAYPFIDRALLRSVLPYLTYLTPFTYGIRPTGQLVELDDRDLLSAAAQGGAAPLMHLSTLTQEGGFSNQLAHLVFTDRNVQDTLVEQVVRTVREKGYRGLDVDFEYVFAGDAASYAALIRRFRTELGPLGLPVVAALAPKNADDQPGLLYEGHDYAAIGAAADEVLLMTYEWGYAYSLPMAVAPLPQVRQVVEYALTHIPAERIWLGIPNYGYIWPLPAVQGQTRAVSISNRYAVSLADRYGAEIQYDRQAQAPWFRYSDEDGRQHEVWFEDARSISAKLSLIRGYGLNGAAYWNLMRPFPQNWVVLNSLFQIQDLSHS